MCGGMGARDPGGPGVPACANKNVIFTSWPECCSESMEAVGLRLLEGADLAPAFEQAGVLPQHVHARISRAKFAKINTVKGQWSLIEDLTAVPQSVAAPSAYFSRPLPAQDAAATVGTMAQGAAAAAAAPAGVAPEEVQRIVRSIAVEILGEGQELDSTGQFPAGT